jgi:hypothetical protein
MANLGMGSHPTGGHHGALPLQPKLDGHYPFPHYQSNLCSCRVLKTGTVQPAEVRSG